MPPPPFEAIQLEPLAPEAPRRRNLTILFSDLSESTRIAESLEAEDYFDLLARLRSLYHSVVARHGGTVAQISGDGMLALFGHPQSREGDARRAVEAALDLHDAVGRLGEGGFGGTVPFRLHSGIHSGLVLLHAGDQFRGRFELLGCATNIASRLCGAAAPGELLVSEGTLGPERSRFEAGPPRRLTLRGTAKPIVTLCVTGRAGARRGAAAPFVGRDRELAALRSFLDKAAAGVPQFVKLDGPPGIGKTRLVEQFLSGLRATGCQVHRGECETAAEPLRPFLDIARSILGTCVEPLATAGALPAAKLAAGVLAVIEAAAERTPLVLFVDDWHAADDASRELMALLGDGVARRLLVVTAARHDVPAGRLFDGFETLPLAPFTRCETAEAVTRFLPGADPFMIDEIAEASGGNALFIEELCHAMAAGGPQERTAERPQGGTPWLANLIESRVARLPGPAARLVRLAAVIGTIIPCALLEAISGHGPDDPLVRSLIDSDFLLEGERAGTLRFKHGITREVIYDSVGLRERRALHLLIAGELIERAAAAGEEPPVEALAFHFGAADDAAATLDHSERAGDKALAASALDRAQAHYARALDAIERLPFDEPLALRWNRIARNYGLACVFDPAREQLRVFERAAQRARARLDRLGLAWAEYWLGYINYALGEPQTAIAHCSAALDAALGSGDDRLIVQIRAVLGQAKAAACDYPGALLLLDEAIEVKRRHRTGRHASVGFAYSLASKAFVLGDMGRFAEAEAGFLEAMDAVRGARHEVEASVLCQHSAVRLWQGRLEEAAECAAEAQRVALRVHSVYLWSMSCALGAYAKALGGAGSEKIDTIRQATLLLEGTGRGQFVSLNYGWLADLLARSGRFDEAIRYAACALRRAHRRDRLGEAMAWRAVARAAHAGKTPRSISYCIERARLAGLKRESEHEAVSTELLEAELLSAAGRAPDNLPGLVQAEARARALDMEWHAAQARALAEPAQLIATISGAGSSEIRPLSRKAARMPIIVPMAKR